MMMLNGIILSQSSVILEISTWCPITISTKQNYNISVISMLNLFATGTLYQPKTFETMRKELKYLVEDRERQNPSTLRFLEMLVIQT
jgi:hypothetical protein